MDIRIENSLEYDRKSLSDEELISLYKRLVLPRLIEDKMLVLLRQGKISKWFSGYGQEAISVGLAAAMADDEFVLPMHRNLGIFTTKGIPLERLFAQFQGKAEGFTKGRDRSFHFGSLEHYVVGMISHLGPQMGVADGIALAQKLTGSGKATFVITGDGGSSEGDFHEAMNLAAVWDLPVIIGVENNGYGLSTPSNEQFRCASFVDKGIGYGIEAYSVDGNNLLEVYHRVLELAASIRENPRPVLLEFRTFRIRGHEEASGTKYYPAGIVEEWEKKDPVYNYRRFLLDENVLDEKSCGAIQDELNEEIQAAIARAEQFQQVAASEAIETGEVEHPFSNQEHLPKEDTEEIRFIDAITSGLDEAMKRHEKLILMGQDIADYGGVFKVTDGFMNRYGKERVRNTPICESAVMGTSLGASLLGYKSMVEMQFADFVSCGFNQIVNNLAKIHYRWGAHADVVVRMPTGGTVGAGPYHSQSTEAWFFHVPGLKLVYPAFPEDAKGLLLQSFEDPNPVLFFEHKALYRSLKAEVPKGFYTLPFGKARIVRAGKTLSIVTYGMGVHWALDWIKDHPEVDVELIDLRTLAPLDIETVMDSVRKTGRCLVLHEDNKTGGIGAELVALLTESCFEYLDAPVKRCASLDTPVPFAQNLENQYMAASRLDETLNELLEF